MSLPAVCFTLDGYPVEMDQDWSCSEQVNLGFDQFRGAISGPSLSRLPWTTGQGSILTAYTTGGVVAWQGRLSAPPQMLGRGLARIAAQGHGYGAVKRTRRFPVKAVRPEAWVIGNASPLNFPQVDTAQPSVSYIVTLAGSNGIPSTETVVAPNTVRIDPTSATSISFAFWAPGAELSRVRAAWITATGGTVSIWSCTGPDIYGSRRLVSSWSGSPTVARPFSVDLLGGDAVVVEFTSSGSGTVRDLVKPVVYMGRNVQSLRSHHVAEAIADTLGWDVSGIAADGTVELPNFDWGGDALSGLAQAAIPDDLRFRVLEDRGAGPLIDFGSWGTRTWEVSGASGASWDLEALELYNRVVVQYLSEDGTPKSVSLDADPDPLPGQTNEFRAVFGGLVPINESTTAPDDMAAAVLAHVSTRRYRGSIVASRVFEQGTGREATHEVRAGDLVRIVDHYAVDGSTTHRISSVSRGPAGIAMGVSVADPAQGEVSAGGGITSGTLIAPILSAPPGSPGSVVPPSSGTDPGSTVLIDPITGGGIGVNVPPPTLP